MAANAFAAMEMYSIAVLLDLEEKTHFFVANITLHLWKDKNIKASES